MVELASDWFSPDAAQPPTQLPAVRKQRINAFHRSGKVLRYRLPLKYGTVLGCEAREGPAADQERLNSIGVSPWSQLA